LQQQYFSGIFLAVYETSYSYLESSSDCEMKFLFTEDMTHERYIAICFVQGTESVDTLLGVWDWKGRSVWSYIQRVTVSWH
jgi:hypothetical protein